MYLGRKEQRINFQFVEQSSRTTFAYFYLDSAPFGYSLATRCSASAEREVCFASEAASCVNCAFGTIGGGTLHFTLCAAQYFTAESPLLHLAKPNFTEY